MFAVYLNVKGHLSNKSEGSFPPKYPIALFHYKTNGTIPQNIQLHLKNFLV